MTEDQAEVLAMTIFGTVALLGGLALACVGLWALVTQLGILPAAFAVLVIIIVGRRVHAFTQDL